MPRGHGGSHILPRKKFGAAFAHPTNWDGVTRALDELEAKRKLRLRHLRGTGLVFWRSP
jgi:hypothetical protein